MPGKKTNCAFVCPASPFRFKQRDSFNVCYPRFSWQCVLEADIFIRVPVIPVASKVRHSLPGQGLSVLAGVEASMLQGQVRSIHADLKEP